MATSSGSWPIRRRGHKQDARRRPAAVFSSSPAPPREPTPAVAAAPCDDRIAGHGTAWDRMGTAQSRPAPPGGSNAPRRGQPRAGAKPGLLGLPVSLGAGGRRHPPRLVNQGFQPSWSSTGDGLISSRALPLRKSGHTPNHSPTIDPCTPPPTPTPNHTSCRSSVSLETSPWASSTTSAPFCCSQPRSC